MYIYIYIYTHIYIYIHTRGAAGRGADCAGQLLLLDALHDGVDL